MLRFVASALPTRAAITLTSYRAGCFWVAIYRPLHDLMNFIKELQSCQSCRQVSSLGWMQRLVVIEVEVESFTRWVGEEAAGAASRFFGVGTSTCHNGRPDH